MTDDADRLLITLRRVADTLGVPLESFSGEGPPDNVGGASQCLSLWQKIRTETARRKALAYLRQIADDEADA